MYSAKSVYLTVSFNEDINDPIILKTTHFIDYNLLLFFNFKLRCLSNILDESLFSVEHMDWFDSIFIASKKENFIPRSIGVDREEFDLAIGSDLANWEENFAVVADLEIRNFDF